MDSGAIRLARDALATPRAAQAADRVAAAAGVGGWAFMVSLAVHAYAIGGAAAVGLAALVRMAPAGLAAPLTGLAADRFPRRDVLLASVLARALLLGGAALIVALDGPFALLLVVATLFTIAATAHRAGPGGAAAAARARTRSRQAAANALWTGLDNGAFVAGAIAGGAARGRARRRRRPSPRRGLAFAAARRSRASRERDPSDADAGRRRRAARRRGVRARRRAARASAAAPSRRARRRRLDGRCASSRATGGCGCSSACCPPARSSRAWSTCSSSSPRCKLVDARRRRRRLAQRRVGRSAGSPAAPSRCRLLARGRLGLALPAGGMLIGAAAARCSPALPRALAALVALTRPRRRLRARRGRPASRCCSASPHDGVRARAFARRRELLLADDRRRARCSRPRSSRSPARAARSRVVGAALPLLVAHAAAPRSGLHWCRPPLADVRQRREDRLEALAKVLEVRRQRQALAEVSTARRREAGADRASS